MCGLKEFLIRRPRSFRYGKERVVVALIIWNHLARYSCAGGSDFPRKNALKEIKVVTHLENRNCLKSS